MIIDKYDQYTSKYIKMILLLGKFLDRENFLLHMGENLLAQEPSSGTAGRRGDLVNVPFLFYC